MEYKQENKIIDFVIPLIRALKTEDGYEYEELFGTGFLIGDRSYGITCAHVIEQLLDNIGERKIITYLIYSDKAYPIAISEFEIHPTEDVAVFRVDFHGLKSVLRIQKESENASFEYQAWGYPRQIAKDPKLLDPSNPEFPSLIYTRGYIRRRIAGPLYPVIIFRGTEFYEVNSLGGSGYSGAPIISSRRPTSDWPIVGIYVGERDSDGVTVGYVVNSECFFEWAPTLLGHSVRDESLK